jgi:hypothetical protein
MEIEDQERNKFENWLKSQPHVLNVGFNKSTKQYLLDEDQDMWVAWQARAELSLKAAARIEELEDILFRLVKENDLAMPNENYQWMYSPMRVECLKVLENK